MISGPSLINDRFAPHVNRLTASRGGTGLFRARPLPLLSFRAVNRAGEPGHDPGLQRHHILPLQLLGKQCFSGFIDVIGRARIGFDDFRCNGLLLPSSDRTATIMALPMHRGPHNTYNAMVMERVGQIEAGWSQSQPRNPDQAGIDALFRMQLLQQALRRRLLDPRGKPLALNRNDPAIRSPEFTEIDAMADLLWLDSDMPFSVDPGHAQGPDGDQVTNAREREFSSATAA